MNDATSPSDQRRTGAGRSRVTRHGLGSDRCRALFVTTLIASSGGVLACGEAPMGDPGVMQIVVGGTESGGEGFVPLDGTDRPLVGGAQGGFHVWLKYQIVGANAGPYRARHSVHRVRDGRPIITAERKIDVDSGDAGMWQLPVALPAFMCPAPIGTDVVDEPMVFRVELLDPDGTPVSEGRAQATPRCAQDPADPQRAFCERICKG